MSLLSRALLRVADRPSPRSQWATSAGGDMTAGAEDPASRHGAPTSVAVALGIIWFLARRLGSIPRVVHERDDRTRRPIRDPRYRALWGAPRPGVPDIPFWVTAFAHLEGWANVYFWKRSIGPYLVGLELIHPSRVKVVLDDRRDAVYLLDGQTSPRYSREDIVHVSGPSWDGVRGVPPVLLGQGPHEVAKLQERWTRNLLRRSSAPSGIVTVPAEWDEEAVDEFYEAWEEQHGGAGGAGGVIMMQGANTFEPVSMSPVDAQLLQSRHYSREEILGLYAPGIPHHSLGWKANASNYGTGIEQQNIHLVQHVFSSRLQLFSNVMSMLLPPELQMWWDTSMWLEGDSKGQAEVWSKMRMNGAATREQWRAAVRMPALDLPDDLFVPKNVTVVRVDNGQAMYATPPKPKGE